MDLEVQFTPKLSQVTAKCQKNTFEKLSNNVLKPQLHYFKKKKGKNSSNLVKSSFM